ncbi:MAG: hypothetical protein ACKPER_18720 [Dolichospermum sp.]
MRYILSPLSKSGEGVGGGVTLYLITSVSAVYLGGQGCPPHKNVIFYPAVFSNNFQPKRNGLSLFFKGNSYGL